MEVTFKISSKYDINEFVMLDNDTSVRHNQPCKTINVKYNKRGIFADEFVYDVEFADGFIMRDVSQYDLRSPTFQEFDKYKDELFKAGEWFHCTRVLGLNYGKDCL